MKNLKLIIIVALSALVASCSPEKTPGGTDVLKTDVPQNKLQLTSQNEDEDIFNIISNMDWRIEVEATEGQPWLEVDPDHGNGNSEITVFYDANGEETPRTIVLRIIGTDEDGQEHTVVLNVTQPEKSSVTPPEPSLPELLLAENFGPQDNGKYKVAEYTAWQRGGEGAANVTYSYTGSTSEPIRSSTNSSGYEGASGDMHLYSASGGVFTVDGIALRGASVITLSIGSTLPSADLKAEYRYDGGTWNAFTADPEKTGNTWGGIAFSSVATGGGENVSLRFTFGDSGRIDDIILESMGGGIVPPPSWILKTDKTNFTNISWRGSTAREIDVIANVEWTATSTADWLELAATSGTGNGKLVFNVLPNAGDARNASIVLKCKDSSLNVPDVTVTLSQMAYEDPGTPGDMPHSWLELPAVTEEGDLHFHTLYAPVGGTTKRNYSMLYDYKEKIAYWVAYPMHPVYLNGSGRSSWSYNPDVPSQYQVSDYASGYSKGHQIPSGDRHTSSNLLNKQTFYYTNMTPQLQNGFNGTIWNNMEQAVRNWTKSSSDTLYVVTGAVLQKVGGNETVKRESTNQIAIPNYYYKVMLKKKSTGSGYTAIGFWFEHKNYSETKPTHKYAYSVDQIEEWTGFDFFANLPTDVQAEIENKTELSEWPL